MVMALLNYILLLPILLLLYGAIGSSALPLLTLLLVLAALPIAAMAAATTPVTHHRLLILAAAATLGGALAALLLPRQSVRSPERLNLLYDLDADAREAHWIVESARGRLPPSLRGAAAFDATPRAIAALGEPAVFLAAAPRLELPPPVLSVRSLQRLPPAAADHLRYQLHLVSARAAPLLQLRFSAQAQVQEVVIESGSMRVSTQPILRPDLFSVLRLWNLPPQGIDISLSAAPGGVIQLSDWSFGLPAQGAQLQRLRPESAVASQLGDVSVVRREYPLSSLTLPP